MTKGMSKMKINLIIETIFKIQNLCMIKNMSQPKKFLTQEGMP